MMNITQSKLCIWWTLSNQNYANDEHYPIKIWCHMLNFQVFYFVTGKMLFLRRFGRRILHIYLKIFIFQLHNHKNQGKFLLSCVTICIVCDVVFYYGFSSPNPKGHVNFCHYLVSAICVLRFRILVIFTESWAFAIIWCLPSVCYHFAF